MTLTVVDATIPRHVSILRTSIAIEVDEKCDIGHSSPGGRHESVTRKKTLCLVQNFFDPFYSTWLAKARQAQFIKKLALPAQVILEIVEKNGQIVNAVM